MSNKKKQLLKRINDTDWTEQEYIELEEINPKVEQKRNKMTEEKTYHYERLKNQDQRVLTQAERRRLEQMPPNRPYNPKIITMNGETFKMVDNQVPAYQKPKKATLPSMLVSCFNCQTPQSVSGTTTKFYCDVCQIPNQCVPSHGIIRCFKCYTKVLFAKGTSDFIKCTKCSTVNELPIEIKQEWGQPVVHPVYYPQSFEERKTLACNPYQGITQDKQHKLEDLVSENDSIGYPDL